jgi:hypothetical protein
MKRTAPDVLPDTGHCAGVLAGQPVLEWDEVKLHDNLLLVGLWEIIMFLHIGNFT